MDKTKNVRLKIKKTTQETHTPAYNKPIEEKTRLQRKKITPAFMTKDNKQKHNSQSADLKHPWYDLYELAPTGYVILNRYGTIRRINKRAASLLAIEPMNATGKPFSNFVRSCSHCDYHQYRQEVLENGFCYGKELHIRNSSQKDYIVLVECVLWSNDEIFCILSDITAYKQTTLHLEKVQHTLRRSLDQQTRQLVDMQDLFSHEKKKHIQTEKILLKRQKALEAIYGISTSVDLSKRHLCDRVTEIISALIETPFVAVTLWGGEDCVYTTSSHTDQGHYIHHTDILNRQSDPIQTVIHTKKSLHIKNNISAVLNMSADTNPKQYQCFIGVPIIDRSEQNVIGIIVGLDEKEHEFSAIDFRIIEIFAYYISSEIAKKRLEEDLHAAQQMKMLGQLTSGVAHEVRNPLNGILAVLEVMEEDLGNVVSLRPYMDHITSLTQRLTILMQDLLVFGKTIRPEKLEQISVVSMIRSGLNAWKNCPQNKNKNVTFTTAPDAQQQIVKVDMSKMEQVIINLLENASQHTTEEQNIWIRASGKKNGYTTISFTDNGCGVKPEYIDKIFEPFFSTRHKGTGLGLSIVKHIMIMHGGKIRAYNNEHHSGLTVEISLPLIDNK